MEPTDNLIPEQGTIAAVVARLARWGRLAPQGLARVEFVSEFSRQRVVSELRSLYADNDIPFYEIELPLEMPAVQIVTDLKRKFQSLEPGVVSLSGFETAFPPDIPLFDSLLLLNFNRENLADHPLRQIWWMTPRFAQEVVQSIPDLDSWFIVKMNLREAVASYPSIDTELVPQIDDLQRQFALLSALQYRRRIEKAILSAESLPVILGLACVAINKCLEVGERQQASALKEKLFQDITQAGMDIDAYLFPENNEDCDMEDVMVRRDLAQIDIDLGDYAEAERLIRTNLRIQRSVWGEFFPESTRELNALAHLHMLKGEYSEAEDLYQQALEINRKYFAGDSHDVAEARFLMAKLYSAQQRFAAAETLFREALVIYEKWFGREHPLTRTVRREFVALLRRLGRSKEAGHLDANKTGE